MKKSGTNAYIGTSGYNFDHWREIFYPADLPKNGWLSFYSQTFNSVEQNVTFYNVPNEIAFENWAKVVSPEFQFSVKGPKAVTHYKKLLEISTDIDRFYQRMELLDKKLGVILWQFQPGWKVNVPRLAEFCDVLKKFPSRYAFEFRHESWFTGEVYKILADLNAAIVLADSPFNVVSEDQRVKTEIQDRKTIVIPETANFVYVRRHGAATPDSSLYTASEIEADAINIKNWLGSSDIYFYYNNDAEGNAVTNALQLKEELEAE